MADPLTPILNNKKNHKINNDPREHTASNEKGAYKPVCLLWCLLSWSERENLRSLSLDYLSTLLFGLQLSCSTILCTYVRGSTPTEAAHPGHAP